MARNEGVDTVSNPHTIADVFSSLLGPLLFKMQKNGLALRTQQRDVYFEGAHTYTKTLEPRISLAAQPMYP